jgi:UDP-glucose 4-epimerase
VIPNFLRQAVRGGTIVMHGDGTQTRDYVFVDDVVNAMIAAATAPGLDNLVINIGSGIGTSIQELVRMVMEVTERKPEVITNPHSSQGVKRMRASVELAKKKLGYQPHFSLEEGLRLTLQRDPRFLHEVPTQPIR